MFSTMVIWKKSSLNFPKRHQKLNIRDLIYGQARDVVNVPILQRYVNTEEEEEILEVRIDDVVHAT